MFYNYEELARNEEKKTDAILEGENAEKPPTNAPQKVHEDFIEETISQCKLYFRVFRVLNPDRSVFESIFQILIRIGPFESVFES